MAFASRATNHVAGAPNNLDDVFVRDRQSGLTIQMSVATDGSLGDSHSGQGSVAISGDGRLVAFESFATNLVPDDTNHAADIFVRGTDPEGP